MLGLWNLEFRVYWIASAVQLKRLAAVSVPGKEQMIIAHLYQSSGLQVSAFGYSFKDIVSLVANDVVLLKGYVRWSYGEHAS